MRAGRLRHRVTIQRVEIEQDPDTGINSRQWVPVVIDEPAAVESLSGRELLAADARQSAVTLRALIRWREDVLPTMRLLHEGTVYAIRAVLPDDTHRHYLRLMLERGTTDGD
jgi:SPP1 family predicted phage head-tail adaptor